MHSLIRVGKQEPSAQELLTFLALLMCSLCPPATSGEIIEFSCYSLAGGMFWFPPEGLLGLNLVHRVPPGGHRASRWFGGLSEVQFT